MISLKGAAASPLDGRPGKHRVSAAYIYLGGALFHHDFGRIAHCAGGIDNIVDQDYGFAFDITDDIHNLGDIGSRSSFIDDGQRSA